MTNKASVYFYGKLAGVTKRDAERFAREAGYVVATALTSSVAVVVLGEGAPLAETRTRLGREFDAESREAFVAGNLEVVTESEFFQRGSSTAADALAASEGAEPEVGYTPAAIAELAGATVATVRRWHKRGLLVPIDETAKLPRFSTQAALVARRLVFLSSTGISDDVIAKRLATFIERASRVAGNAGIDRAVDPSAPLLAFDAEPDDAQASIAQRVDIASAILATTLSTDGRDLLYLAPTGPIDANGQRRFDFMAFPADGSFEKPESAALSEEEEQIALAERLAAWNESATSATGRPAFLDLFRGDGEAASVSSLISEQLPAADGVISTHASATDADVISAHALATDADVISTHASATDADVIFAPAPATATDVMPAHVADVSAAPEPAPETLAPESLEDEPVVLARPNALALCQSAWELEREGYWEEAARTYREAALAGAREPGLYCRLGKLLAMMGENAAARERFYNALELDPDYGDAKLELGKTLATLGELDDAKTAFRSALQNRRDDVAARLELGKVYLRLNELDAAEREFRYAVAKIKDARLAEDVRRLLAVLGRR